MTSIIITIVLNLLLGNPTDTTKQQDQKTTSTTTTISERNDGTMNAMGGSGTWTNIEK